MPKSLGTFLVDCCSCCLGEEVWRAGVWCMSKRTQVRWSSEKHQRGSASLLGLSERAKWRGLILIIIGGKVLVGHEASSFEVIRFCMRCVRGEDPEEDQVACVFCSAAGSCSKLSCLHCDKSIPFCLATGKSACKTVLPLQRGTSQWAICIAVVSAQHRSCPLAALIPTRCTAPVPCGAVWGLSS